MRWRLVLRPIFSSSVSFPPTPRLRRAAPSPGFGSFGTFRRGTISNAAVFLMVPHREIRRIGDGGRYRSVASLRAEEGEGEKKPTSSPRVFIYVLVGTCSDAPRAVQLLEARLIVRKNGLELSRLEYAHQLICLRSPYPSPSGERYLPPASVPPEPLAGGPLATERS